MRRSMVISVVLLVLLVACTSADDGGAGLAEPPQPFEALQTVSSPDGGLRFEVGIDYADRPVYRIVRTVDASDVVVIEDSTLGLEVTLDGVAWSLTTTEDVSAIGSVERREDSFTLPTGKARRATRVENRHRFVFDSAEAPRWGIEVSVDDAAAAFRYVLADDLGSVELAWERTSVHVDDSARAWLQEHDVPTIFTPAYESLRGASVLAGDPGSTAAGWTLPALFESDAGWILIAEAGVGDGAAGSHLSPVVDGGEYFIDLPDSGEGNGFGRPNPVAAAPWESPWRVIVTSQDLGDIVASDHVRFLSEPATFDHSWVRPGRVSWSWWSDHESSRDPDAMRPFVDLAVEMGWEYSLIDANWNTFGDDELEALVDYANERSIGVFLWYNSGGPNNVVTEAPRDRMADPAVRREEFARIAELGVVGVKVDFFHSDKPIQIEQYRDILRDAADVELLVNFHGSTMPRGWAREFPNLMTMESVRGAEMYTFDTTYAASAPRQNTILPFTRNVVGSMDYTPVILGDTVRRVTTNGHELALAVVFESALQHFVDTPDAYGSQPLEVIDLLRTVPTVWDETHLVSGAPEDHVALARRHDDTWWLGAINGTAESQSVPFSPVELGVDPSAPILIVCDNPDWERAPGRAATWDDPNQYVIRSQSLSSFGAVVPLELPPFGGCLVRVG